ncbi:3-hydroxyacyl-CoA dehydrogenase NAD-binding domain-containing protein [Paracoccus sp. SSJ]|uniref:3-hydroxyacyl-CoA dehydrogenase n=1 Tax=Paracoccus sp. SSJ TaxID=3050636 RepID=UPI00254B92C5|nr:3-hydroxyacyl-CoA dehydrogenase NAD-binding domain-containing protein [Paracoccus sp. SSJ]MDK8871373.1 3-hydroxyacyl-CoA dehydrogenase NAD-binding domain-containing protein [Paracoccus sp. SSJ]
MTTIAVIGLGTMGLGIAQTYAAAGFALLATDAVPEARETALDRLRAGLAPRVRAGKLAQADLDAILARITVVDGPKAMGATDLAIEAVVERMPVKQSLFAALEAVVAPDAVLASNTSSLSVAAMAEGLARPERLLGLHFFNPAPVMKLVELVAHPGTGAAALDRARRLTEAAGKTVIPCPDRPGFIVNRCARPFYGEALAMLEEGRSTAEIDAAMQAAGYPLGPFGLIDLVGADINLAATESLAAAMEGHPRYHVFDALRRQVASGDLGRKTGRGFLYPDEPGPAPKDAEAIVRRIEAALVNEAGWLLAEGGTTQQGIDTALKLGLNFPRGPFEVLAAQGHERVLARLDHLAAAAPAHLDGRYQPAPVLTR